MTYEVGDVVTVVDTSKYGDYCILEPFPFEGVVKEAFTPRIGTPYYMVMTRYNPLGWYVEPEMIDDVRTRERAAFAALREIEGDEES